MAPALTLLQLDTAFPRVPGDVGCSETFLTPIEVLPVAQATVGQVVTADPGAIPIAPFEAALARARGDIVVTSCGFLSYWQTHLAAQTSKPFISSALTALPELCKHYAAPEILTLTFDANTLNSRHFGPYQTEVLGLPEDMHLRKVITENKSQLDIDVAAGEIAAFVGQNRAPHHKHILLECTNLPPYKDAIAEATGLQITDILTCIEAARPNTVNPTFLRHRRITN